MKHILNLGMVASLLVGCASQPANQYRISGTIQGTDGENIYLTYTSDSDLVVTDTARIENGSFVFAGTLEKPYLQATIYMGDGNDYRNPRRLFFYVEPRNMTVAIDTAQFGKPVIGGSLTQAQMDSLSTGINAILQEADYLYKAIEAESDPDKKNELRGQLEPYIDRMRQTQMDFIQTHPNSYVIPDLLRSLVSGMTYEELKETYDAIGENVKQCGALKEIETELAALEHTQPGAPAPDFATVDVNGDSIRFSEAVKGKYVLLDFWASWCVPCRKAFPHVKEVAKKYKDKGLVVFCVADNDSWPDQWREAIEKDGIGDFFHVLRGMKVLDQKTLKIDRSHDLDDLYAVHALPTKYLIDDTFKIIGKIDGEEELDAKLKEIFGE